jgi:hypothetical protein
MLGWTLLKALGTPRGSTGVGLQGLDYAPEQADRGCAEAEATGPRRVALSPSVRIQLRT